MIVVDTSVWIPHLHGFTTSTTIALRRATETGQVVLADVVLLELLQGARSDADARRLREDLEMYPIVNVLDETIAIAAAANYRLLRGKGITIRKTPDLILGTFCIELGGRLLHDDRDFSALEAHLGLEVFRPA